jgi:hypothetical protein
VHLEPSETEAALFVSPPTAGKKTVSAKSNSANPASNPAAATEKAAISRMKKKIEPRAAAKFAAAKASEPKRAKSDSDSDFEE